MRTPITEEGMPCRHCGTPVVWKVRKNTKPRHADQDYYYSQWLKCQNRRCRAIYLVEKYRRYYPGRENIVPTLPRDEVYR